MPTPKHVAAALAQLDLRCPVYDEDAQYYDGTTPEVITSHRLRQLFESATLDAFRVNYARTPVDVLLERTQIQGINCSDPAASAVLDQVWDDNQLGLEAKDVHRMAYEFGDAYVIGWPDEELASGVSAYAHDPRNVRIFYDPQRPRTKSHAIHRWMEQGDPANGLSEGLWLRVNLYYPDFVEQWVSERRIDPLIDGSTTAIIPEIVPYAAEPYIESPTPGIIPVFHFRTQRPYGRSELEDAKGPQNMLTKLCTTMMVSVDYAGYPQRYVTTDSALSAPSGDAFSHMGPLPDDPDLPDEGLSDDSAMEAGPGSTWLLSGASVKVGQFTAAETMNFLNAIHSLIKQMSAVTDIPLHYFDRTGDMPSGESFRRAETPLTNKVEDRESLFGVTWHEFFDYCLAVNRLPPSDAQPMWAPPTVWIDLESWQTAILELQAGVPLDQVLRERGFTEDQIALIMAANPAPPPVRGPQFGDTPPADSSTTTGSGDMLPLSPGVTDPLAPGVRV